MVQEEILFKDISYLEIWWPLCLAEQNIRANLVEGIIQFCEIILNLDQWFRRRCHLFLIKSFICVILVEGIITNNSVKLFCIWTSGSGDVA